MKVWQTDKQIKKIIPKNKFFLFETFVLFSKSLASLPTLAKKKNGDIQKQQGI